MASLWFKALRQMDSDLDAQMGETVAFFPMRVLDYDGARLDPDRAGFEVVGLVDEREASPASPGHVRVEVQVSGYTIDIRRGLVPAGVDIKKNDEFGLIDRGGLRVRVDRVDPYDESRLIIHASILGTRGIE